MDSWYFDGNGKVIIPAGACQQCGMGGGDHYFGCPVNAGAELAQEREEEAWYGLARDWDDNAVSARLEAQMEADAQRDRDEVYVGLGDFDGGW